MDEEIEKEAVDFFKEPFDVWGTDVVAISKLMGKKSQAPSHIRKHVGKTIEQFTSFLNRHPEKFVVKGETVQVIIDEDEESESEDGDDKRTSPRPKAWNPEKIEHEAVQYFKEAIKKWGLKQVAVRSLASKKADAPPEFRIATGTTDEEFITFLQRHPQEFAINSGIVALTEKLNLTKNNLVNGKYISELDLAAIEYFRRSMISRGETEVELKKLVGRRTLAPASVRSAVGDDVSSFICKHPDVFNVKNGIVTLKSQEKVSELSSINDVGPSADTADLVATDFVKELLRKVSGRCNICRLLYNVNEAPETITKITGNTELEFTEFIKRHPKHLIIDCDSEVCLTEEADSFDITLKCQLGIVNNIIVAGGFLTYERKSCVYFPKSALVEFNVENVHLNDLLVLGQKMYFDAKTNADPNFKANYKATRVWNAEADAEIPSPVLNLDEEEKQAHKIVGSLVQKKIQQFGPQQIRTLYPLFNRENIKENVGYMPHDIINFVTCYPKIFRLSQGLVSLVNENSRKAAPITYVSRNVTPNTQHSKPTIINRAGEISRVFPTSGFIYFNTGGRAVSNVFFHVSNVIDNKYNRTNLFDLVKVGDRVRFDAVPGKRGGSAEWAATRVWREGFVPPRLSRQPLPIVQRQQPASHANTATDNSVNWDELEEELEKELGGGDDLDDLTSNTSSKDWADLVNVKEEKMEFVNKDYQNDNFEVSTDYDGSDFNISDGKTSHLREGMLPYQDVVIETGSSISTASSDTSFNKLINKCGKVVHLMSDFGIIQYKTEIVHFDMNGHCVKGMMDTRPDWLQLNNMVFFDAVLSQTRGTMKWQALRVWPIGPDQVQIPDSYIAAGMNIQPTFPSHPAVSPPGVQYQPAPPQLYTYPQPTPVPGYFGQSGTNFPHVANQYGNQNFVSVVQPKLPHTLSNGQIMGQPTSPIAPVPTKLFVEAACQTTITGDIKHTKEYNAEKDQVISIK